MLKYKGHHYSLLRYKFTISPPTPRILGKSKLDSILEILQKLCFLENTWRYNKEGYCFFDSIYIRQITTNTKHKAINEKTC